MLRVLFVPFLLVPGQGPKAQSIKSCTWTDLSAWCAVNSKGLWSG